MGLVVAVPFLLQPAALFEPPPKPVRPPSEQPKDDKAGWSLLLSGPILLNLLFFVMITFATTGVQNYSVVALNEKVQQSWVVDHNHCVVDLNRLYRQPHPARSQPSQRPPSSSTRPPV